MKLAWTGILFIALLFARRITSLRGDSSRVRSGTAAAVTKMFSARPEIREITAPTSSEKYYWDLSSVAFSLLPLAPGNRRKTLIEEIVKDQIWTLDQIQGIINVNVPVRSTIVKLKGGGLFVYNPVAPTRECLEYVRSLEKAHGAVKHIVLGTLGLEHKALAGPFSQFFPEAQVWLQPGQWSFPVNLPNYFLGFPSGDRLKEIPNTESGSTTNPWADDFEFEVLGKLSFKSVGGFGETAFYHKASKTLIVTDSVVQVVDTPSPILEEDPRALLFHSRDKMLDDVQDTKEARLRGWRRMVLFSLVFFPAGIQVSGIFETLSQIGKLTPGQKLLGKGSVPISGGLYPWTWVESEVDSFRALQRPNSAFGTNLLVAPILRELIMNREPQRVLAWAEKVSKWPFTRIIPAHLENNLKAKGSDFRKAFTFLESPPSSSAPTKAASGVASVGNNNNLDNSKSMHGFGNWLKTTMSGSIGSKNNKNEAGQQMAPQPTGGDLSLLKSVSRIFTTFGVVAEEVKL